MILHANKIIGALQSQPVHSTTWQKSKASFFRTKNENVASMKAQLGKFTTNPRHNEGYFGTVLSSFFEIHFKLRTTFNVKTNLHLLSGAVHILRYYPKGGMPKYNVHSIR